MVTFASEACGLLLMALLVAASTADPLGAAKKKPHSHESKQPNKHPGRCGENEHGVCRKDRCSGPLIFWRQSQNRCPSGETCCRRTTSYGCATDKGRSCQFPFMYDNVWYEDCTTVDSDHGKPWCSYQRDDYGNHVKGKWGYCNSNCTVQEIKCITCDVSSSSSQQYFMHPSDCTKYLQCSPSGPKEMPCPLGTVWDQSLLTCNDKTKTPCATGQYINSDGSCKTEEDWCLMDPGCREKFTTCRRLMCGTLPSNFKRDMKECAMEMSMVLPVIDHPGHFVHEHHHHHVSECGRPFRPQHPSQDGTMRLLDPPVAAELKKCILTKNGLLKSWDGLVNRGVMMAMIYQPFLDYPELVDPVKEAIEATCPEPVDYEIHDFYRCVHKTCVDNIVP